MQGTAAIIISVCTGSEAGGCGGIFSAKACSSALFLTTSLILSQSGKESISIEVSTLGGGLVSVAPRLEDHMGEQGWQFALARIFEGVPQSSSFTTESGVTRHSTEEAIVVIGAHTIWEQKIPELLV